MKKDPRRTKRSDMRKQPTKDSNKRRVNFDNERASKFNEEFIARKEDARSNAYVWYAKSKEMTEAAGRVGFSQTSGLPDGSGLIVPGVMAINYACAVGTGAGSPINQAKDSIYSYTVHANSRNTSYSGTDQMMLIYAGKEVFRYIGNLIRAYGVMLNYTQLNAYTPDALLMAMGFDAARRLNRDGYAHSPGLFYRSQFLS